MVTLAMIVQWITPRNFGAERAFRIPLDATPRFFTGASRIAFETRITIVMIKESLARLLLP